MTDELEDALWDASGEERPDERPDPVDEPDVKACKRDGCALPVESARGPYGGLCFTHAEEQARARRRGAEAAPEAVRQPQTPGGTQTLGQLARKLVKPAERAERAVRAAKGAKGEQRAALLDLQSGLEALRDATAALIRE